MSPPRPSHACPPLALWAAALDEARQPFFSPGHGEGWPALLAHLPAASYSGPDVSGLADWVAAQQAAGRLVAGFLGYDACAAPGGQRPDPMALPLQLWRAYPAWLELTPEGWQWMGQPGQTEGGEDWGLQAENWLRRAAALDAPPFEPPAPLALRATTQPQTFQDRVAAIRQQIGQGSYYQVNYAHRLEGAAHPEPRRLFGQLAAAHQPAYGAYLEGDGPHPWALLSLSPERFISCEQGRLTTTPIKGTRPRGNSPAQDQALRQALEESPKERAELAMITDLLRNDLGGVCLPGTVRVEAARVIEGLPTVWHSHARISGQLLPGLHPIRALLAMSPGGSVTGCPKEAAIQAIAQLEPERRGAYTGSLGWLAPDGRAAFNIAIRTLVQHQKKLSLWVGGGITLDSDPQAEYDETLAKSRFATGGPIQPANPRPL